KETSNMVKHFSLQGSSSHLHHKRLVVMPATDPLVQSEITARVNAELTRLARREREALLAWAGEHPQGHSCRRLARRYHVTVAAVSKWADKARRQIADQLGDLQ